MHAARRSSSNSLSFNDATPRPDTTRAFLSAIRLASHSIRLASLTFPQYSRAARKIAPPTSNETARRDSGRTARPMLSRASARRQEPTSTNCAARRNNLPIISPSKRGATAQSLVSRGATPGRPAGRFGRSVHPYRLPTLIRGNRHEPPSDRRPILAVQPVTARRITQPTHRVQRTAGQHNATLRIRRPVEDPASPAFHLTLQSLIRLATVPVTARGPFRQVSNNQRHSGCGQPISSHTSATTRAS